MAKKLKCVQINLQHTKSPTANLTILINKSGIAVNLIQKSTNEIKGNQGSNFPMSNYAALHIVANSYSYILE